MSCIVFHRSDPNDPVMKLYNEVKYKSVKTLDISAQVAYGNPNALSTYIGMWQDANKKSIDEYPTKDELINYIDGRLSKEGKYAIIINGINSFSAEYDPYNGHMTKGDRMNHLNQIFDPFTLQLRASLIADTFSLELTREHERQRKQLEERISRSTDAEEIDQLAAQLEGLDRLQALNNKTLRGLFMRVKESFDPQWILDEDMIEEFFKQYADELSEIKDDKKREERKEELRKEALEFAQYRREEFAKIFENFEPLADIASLRLKDMEGIMIKPTYYSFSEVDNATDGQEGNIVQVVADPVDEEEMVRDDWMKNYDKMDSFDTLSKRVRAMLTLIQLTQEDGSLVYDDLGYEVYVNAQVAHGKILEALQPMIDGEDLITLLEKEAKITPWVSQVIDKLKADPSLMSDFYKHFNQDFVSLWAQRRRKMKDGTRTNTTVISVKSGNKWLNDMVTFNFENGTRLVEDGIYDKPGEVNKKNAQKILDKADKFWQNFYKELSEYAIMEHKSTQVEDVRIQYMLDHPKSFEELAYELKAVGVEVSENDLVEIFKADLEELKTSKHITGLRRNEVPSRTLRETVRFILEGVRDGKLDIKKDSKGRQTITEPLSVFRGEYAKIARVLRSVGKDLTVTMVNEAGSSWSTYRRPSHLTRLLKRLKNTMPDKQLSPDDKKQYGSYYEKFIWENYAQYDFFYDQSKMSGNYAGRLGEDGWRSPIMRDLYNNTNGARDVLEVKQLLHIDGKEYIDWSSASLAGAMLTEFYLQREKDFAWYMMPIFSDFENAMFMKLKRFHLTDYTKSYGKEEEEMDDLLEDLAMVVQQEYNRINDVRARDEAIKNGDTSIRRIAGYDMSYDDDGKLESVGGAKFLFFPKLNDVVVNYDSPSVAVLGRKASGNMVRLYDFINRKANETAGGDDLRTGIKAALSVVLEQMFNEAMEQYANIGLFNEMNDEYRYLDNTLVQSAKKQKRDILNLISSIERNSVLRSKFQKTEGISNLIKAYRQNLRLSPDEESSAKAELLEQLTGMYNLTYSNGNHLISDVVYFRYKEMLSSKAPYVEYMKDFFYNHVYAQTMMQQLTEGDMAFANGGDPVVRQKRYARWLSPGLTLNTAAEWNGERVGKTHQSVIILQDAKKNVISDVLDGIKAVTAKAVEEGRISKIDKDYIDSQYMKFNVTDSQSYRTLESMRTMMIMGYGDGWNMEKEASYNRIRSGKWDRKDFDALMPSTKPVTSTEIPVDSLDGRKIRMPVFDKTSEYVLLALYDTMVGPIKNYSRLKELHRFMVDHDIDLATFESAMKEGNQGVININDVAVEDVYSTLEKVTGLGNGEVDPNIVHYVPFDDVFEQMKVPEHLFDAVQLAGTQVMRLAMTDMRTTDEITLPDGVRIKFSEALHYYNMVNTENILQAFKAVSAEFADIDKLSVRLQDAVAKSTNYSPELLKAVTVIEITDLTGNKKKVFNIPLYDPIISTQVQNLINSYVKKKVNRAPRKGGSVVQVTSWGMSDELNIVFKDSKGKHVMTRKEYFATYPNFKGRKSEEERNEEYEAYLRQNADAIEYMECYMPAYSKKFFKDFLVKKEVNGKTMYELDVKKLPPELRKLIGYRIPTESKHSMLPLYIKDFLPTQNGSAIMLPREVTAFTGSDFDVDKLFLFLYEFETITNFKPGGEKALEKDAFRALNEQTNIQYVSIDLKAKLGFALTEKEKKQKAKADKFIADYKKRHKNDSKYSDREYRKIEYKMGKSAEENGTKARNNFSIDLMWGVLTHSSQASALLSPGNLDEGRKVGSIMDILRNAKEDDVREEIKNITGKDYSNGSIYEALMGMKLRQIDAIKDRVVSKPEPMSPFTNIVYHRSNMSGQQLIGIVAVQNSGHAIMQHTGLSINSNGLFVLNGNKSLRKGTDGKPLFSLHETHNSENHRITDTLGTYINLAVDNGKEMKLESLNANRFTINSIMMLVRMGYRTLEVSMLMNQPIIREMSDLWMRTGNLEDAISIVIERYKNIAKFIKDENPSMKEIWNSFKPDKLDEGYQFPIEDMEKDMLISQEMNTDPLMRNHSELVYSNHYTDLYYKQQYWSRQLRIGYLFRQINKVAQTLSDLTLITRPEARAAGATAAETILTILNYEDFFTKASDEKSFPLSGVEVMPMIDPAENSYEEMRETLYSEEENPIGFITAHHTFGIMGLASLYIDYMPFFRPAFVNLVRQLKSVSRTERIDVKKANKLLNNYVSYLLTLSGSLGDTRLQIGAGEEGPLLTTARGKRFFFINHFADYFDSMKEGYKEIRENEFVKKLSTPPATKNITVRRVTLNGGTSIKGTEMTRLQSAWEDMLYSEDEGVREFAINLFRYCYYVSGFNFGPHSFARFAPLGVRHATEGYFDVLNLMNTDNALYEHNVNKYGYDEDYFNQFMLHNTDDNSLWYEIKNPKKDETPLAVDFREIDLTGRGARSVRDELVLEFDIHDYEGYLPFIAGNIDMEKGLTFRPYIKRQEGDRTFYYILEDSISTNGYSMAIYKRADPRGIKGYFVEYEYGSDPTVEGSVIESNTGNTFVDKTADFVIMNQNVDVDSVSQDEEGVNEFNSALDAEEVREEAMQNAFMALPQDIRDMYPGLRAKYVSSAETSTKNVNENVDSDSDGYYVDEERDNLVDNLPDDPDYEDADNMPLC